MPAKVWAIKADNNIESHRRSKFGPDYPRGLTRAYSAIVYSYADAAENSQ